MAINMILRNDALVQQVNYTTIIDTTKAWADTNARPKWALLYRVVTCTVAGWVDPKTFRIDLEDKVTTLLENAPNPLSGSILADAKLMVPELNITQDHVTRAQDIIDNWHSQFFTAELASDITPGPPGVDGKPGIPGPAGGAFTFPGAVNFDQLGANDNDRTTAVNTFFRDNKRGTIIIPNRTIVTNVQLELWSWFSMMGGVGVPSREYGRCRWQYNGPESSIFKWVNNTGRHSYPADGSPRDGNVIGIEFVGNKDVIPRTTTIAGKTLWYWLFENCGGNGIKSFSIGYGNGTQYLVGVSHAQAFTNTLLDIGGSENTWFGHKHCFIDTKVLEAGQPELRSKMDKSFINKVMTTTRGSYLALEIYGGHALHVNEVSFDAQDSDPANTSAIRITGGSQIHICNNIFKGMALGGQPIIDVQNVKQLIINDNDFVRRGATNKIGPVSTPLVKVGAGVSDRQVVFGLENTPGDYNGRLVAARVAQIINKNEWSKVGIG